MKRPSAILQESLDEEGEADKKFAQIAMSVVNAEASATSNSKYLAGSWLPQAGRSSACGCLAREIQRG